MSGWQSLEDVLERGLEHAPLAGFGFGLALSRLYARYFGGDLTISSMEGYGTDAYVHLRATASDAVETLPRFDRHELQYLATNARFTTLGTE